MQILQHIQTKERSSAFFGLPVSAGVTSPFSRIGRNTNSENTDYAKSINHRIIESKRRRRSNRSRIHVVGQQRELCRSINGRVYHVDHRRDKSSVQERYCGWSHSRCSYRRFSHFDFFSSVLYERRAERSFSIVPQSRGEHCASGLNDSGRVSNRVCEHNGHTLPNDRAARYRHAPVRRQQRIYDKRGVSAGFIEREYGSLGDWTQFGPDRFSDRDRIRSGRQVLPTPHNQRHGNSDLRNSGDSGGATLK